MSNQVARPILTYIVIESTLNHFLSTQFKARFLFVATKFIRICPNYYQKVQNLSKEIKKRSIEIQNDQKVKIYQFFHLN